MVGFYAILAMIIGAESLLGNLLLIIVIFSGCTKCMAPSFRFMQLMSCSIRVIYTVTFALTAPVIYYVSKEDAILLVQGVEMDIIPGRILLCFVYFFTGIAMAIPCVQFVHRYFYLVTIHSHSSWDKWHTWLLALIPFSSAIGIAIASTIQDWPTDLEEIRFKPTAYNLNIEADTAFLVISLREYTSIDAAANTMPISVVNTISTIASVCLIFGSFVIMLFCGYKIHKSFNMYGTQLSERTLKMQKQLQRTLICQAIVPLVFLDLPFLVEMLGPIFGIDCGRTVMELSAILYIMFPAFCPWFCIFFVDEIRTKAIALVRKHSLVTTSNNNDYSSNNSKKPVVEHKI